MPERKPPDSRNYKVITFYSYKGGVGRSMALANCAALLAGQGRRVLAVDFDLEAPGLGRYFEMASSPKPKPSGGLVNLFAAYERGETIDWRTFVIPIQLPQMKGRLDLLPAGGGSEDYAQLVQGLNWDRLFEHHDFGDYLCRMREAWRDEYDLVLIDSRTGMSDIGGICTILLPDALVVLFTANEQSINGTAEVVRRARAAQEELPVERARLLAIPVLSRDDRRTEYKQSQRWRRKIAVAMKDFFSDWVWESVTPLAVLQRLYLPQIAYWSFGERLPVVENPDEIDDPSSLGAAYQRLAQLIDADLNWDALERGSYSAEAEPPRAGLSLAQRYRKSIVLLSDGSGNSAARLLKTNVARMHEALDLGPAPAGERGQIAYYDTAASASGLRPIALLSGIFGIGLKRNVLEMYRYACRNYRAAPKERPGEDATQGGDEIYGIGFGRGAFAIRLVVAMIAEQGLVIASDERELHRKSLDAYRAFRQSFHPRMNKAPALLWRWTRDALIAGWRRLRAIPPYDRSMNYRPRIRFVGVWDTIAGYGGPTLEITRAIDNWIYPLGLPDLTLHPRILAARHALALDEEREALHPILWDEVHEKALIEEGQVAEGRLKQVWFAGAHADVGGGYLEPSLSYVPLLWMTEEANKAGLRTLDVVTDRYRALASSVASIHDSRAGLGGYYRYQPRNLAAWLDPPDVAAGAMGSDNIGPDGEPRGLLTRTWVHESVIARIASGTDDYAPFNLAGAPDLLPGPLEGETVPVDDAAEATGTETLDRPSLPLVTASVRKRIADPDEAVGRMEAMERVWDLVWWRRIAFFALLALTASLLLLPWWGRLAPEPPLLGWAGGVIGLLAIFLPAFLDPVVETVAAHGYYFFLSLLLIILIKTGSNQAERTLRDHSRAVWRAIIAGSPLPPARRRTLASRLRRSPFYRLPMKTFERRLLPALFASFMTLAILWLLAGLYVQVRLPALEAGRALCNPRFVAAPAAVGKLRFSTAASCTSTGLSVTKGSRYVVDLEVGQPWRDGGMPATPVGLGAEEIGLFAYAAVPFRRVITAKYLQPVARIEPKGRFVEPGGVRFRPLHFVRQGTGSRLWRAEFVADATGRLTLFANDAVLPSPLDDSRRLRTFYANNLGTACLTIREGDATSDTAPVGACTQGSAE